MRSKPCPPVISVAAPDHVDGGGIEDVLRLEQLRQGPPICQGLGDGEIGGSEHLHHLECLQTDGSGSHDGDPLAHLHVGLIGDAHHHGDVLQKAGLLQRQSVGDLPGLGFVPDHVLRHSRVESEAPVRAEVFLAVQTVVTGTAVLDEVAGNPVAHLEALADGLRSDFHDRAGDLVAEAERRGAIEEAVDGQGVGAADAAVSDPDSDILCADFPPGQVSDLHATPVGRIGVEQVAPLHRDDGLDHD